MKNWLTIMTASALSLAVHAKDVAIVGATVHTMGPQGSLENATVVMRDGKILSVGQQAAPAGAEIIDASGKVVTPGLMGAYTSLGLVEVGLSAGTVDATVDATPLTTAGAALDVQYAINPDSSLIAVSRIEGVTSAATGLSRTQQLFNGQGALISLGDDASPVLKPRAFVRLAVDNDGADSNGGSRVALWGLLEQAFAEASDPAVGRLTATSEWHGWTTKADVKVIKQLLNGDIPLLIEAKRAADIRQVLALKARHPGLDITLLEATEGWRVAQALAAADIAVILDPERNLPYAFDQLGATLHNAARLHAAGVDVAIGMNTHNIRLAKQHAGNAVANGLPWEAGLAALTRVPARIYGVDDQLGTLEAGKRADVVIWSGDPLEVTHNAEQVFINGQAMSMESRQTRLRDRYLKLANGAGAATSHYVRP